MSKRIVLFLSIISILIGPPAQADSDTEITLKHRGINISVKLSQQNTLGSNKFEEGPIKVFSSQEDLNGQFEFYEGDVTLKDGNKCRMRPYYDADNSWDSIDYRISIMDDKGNVFISTDDPEVHLNSEIFVTDVTRLNVNISITKIAQFFKCQVGQTFYSGTYSNPFGLPTKNSYVEITKRSTIFKSDTLYGGSIVNACFDYTEQQSEALYIDSPQVRCTSPHTAQTYLFKNIPEIENPHFGNNDMYSRYGRYFCRGPEFDSAKKVNPFINSFIYSFSSTSEWDAGIQWIRCDGVHFQDPDPTKSSPLVQWQDKIASSSKTPNPVNSADPKVSSSPSPDLKKTVTVSCKKGKVLKKVSGANPKCPKGFKKG